MKTREERAREFADRSRERTPNDGYVNEDICCTARTAFLAGAESEHAELTRWNDPKEHPEEGKMVLVKRTADSLLAYDLAHVANGKWVDSWCGVIDLGSKIIGWREIHQ